MTLTGPLATVVRAGLGPLRVAATGPPAHTHVSVHNYLNKFIISTYRLSINIIFSHTSQRYEYLNLYSDDAAAAADE